MITMTSAEAQNNFGKLLDTAQREPVVITRHGRPTAYLVSEREIAVIENERQRRLRAAASLKTWFERVDAVRSPEANLLTDEDINRMVHEAREEIDAERRG